MKNAKSNFGIFVTKTMPSVNRRESKKNVIKKYNNKLRFENLTLAPIEKDLINFKLLNKKEKKYLNEYHKKIYFILSSHLNKNEKNWLRSFIN